MRFDRNTVSKIGLLVALCLLFSLVRAQEPAPQAGRGAAPAQRGGRGMMAGDPRVQNRTYHFADTNEELPYAVFVSSKVAKDKKAPLIVALHGLNGNPGTLLRGNTLDLAEEGGYILVGPMGYNSSGWYGMPASPGGRGGRGGAPAPAPATTPVPAPATAPLAQPTSQTPAAQPAVPTTRGMQPGGRGQPGAVGGTAVTDQAKVRELSEKDVMNVLELVRKEFNVDERRTYLMGHSMGGGGTLFLGEKYASNWAAIAAIAPAAFGFQPDSLEKIKDMPVMIVQGDADTLVQPAGTRRWVDKMKELKMTYEYKEIPGGDHGSVVATGMPDIFKFFAKYSKPEPKDGTTGTTSTPTGATTAPTGPTPAPTTATSASNETITRTIEDGGTGPYKAMLVGDSSLATHAIFRPNDLSAFGENNKLPIVAWGNGACANSSQGFQNFLSEVASHGFLVMAIGPAQTTDGRGGGVGGGSGTKSSQLLDAIDWAIAQNNNKESRYYKKIDASKIAVIGQSCGGLQALEVSPDSRITTTVVCNSGILNSAGGASGAPSAGVPTPAGNRPTEAGRGDTMPVVAGGAPGAGGGMSGGGRGGAPGGGGGMMTMPPLTKDHLNKLHAPVLYLLGGSSDMAYLNGTDDFRRIEKLPAFMANMDVGHGGTYGRPHGGEFATVAVAWFKWQLKGDAEAAKMFTGVPCGLSKSPNWKVEKKNIP
jgi:predicted peptidase